MIKKKYTPKILKSVLIIAFILVVIAFFYNEFILKKKKTIVASSTTNSQVTVTNEHSAQKNNLHISSENTLDWLVYSSSDYKFHFKYPPSFGKIVRELTPTEVLDCNNRISRAPIALQDYIDGPSGTISILISCGDDLKQYLNAITKLEKEDASDELVETSLEDINIESRVYGYKIIESAFGKSYFFSYVSAANYDTQELYIPLRDGLYVLVTKTAKDEQLELTPDEARDIVGTYMITN